MNEIDSGRQDTLYARELDNVEDFAFNDEVTQVFDDMVRRSVPGYDVVVDLIGVIAASQREKLHRPLNCVDLGCSRGAVTRSILTQVQDSESSVLAIDNSASMIEAAKRENKDSRVTFKVGDALDSTIENADMVVMNLLLQFIEPAQRLLMLKKIHRGLRDDGLLVLTEKVEADESFVDFHLQFKKSKGYSELEIQQKRDALEKVMVIDSLEKHQKRLEEAGFQQVKVWFQLLNWASFIARP